MPPKTERLTKKDFSGLTNKKTTKNVLFDVVFSPSPIKKVGCVVLKKRTPKAVDRNKIKRKIYNTYRNLPHTPTQIVIFYPQNIVLRTPQQKLTEEMGKVFATLQQ